MTTPAIVMPTERPITRAWDVPAAEIPVAAAPWMVTVGEDPGVERVEDEGDDSMGEVESEDVLEGVEDVLSLEDVGDVLVEELVVDVDDDEEFMVTRLEE